LVRQGRGRCRGAGHAGGQRVLDLVVAYERAGDELRALLREHRRNRLRRAGLRARRALEAAAAWRAGGSAAAAVVGHAWNTRKLLRVGVPAAPAACGGKAAGRAGRSGPAAGPGWHLRVAVDAEGEVGVTVHERGGLLQVGDMRFMMQERRCV
jgi:hypothetical protein